MSRIAKFTVAATLVLPLTLGGCVPKKGTASPEDYFPLIQVALAGGETGAMIARNEFIEKKNWKGCVAGEALISAFDSAQQVLSGRLQNKIVIPAVDIDVSECLTLRNTSGESARAIAVYTQVAGYVAPEEAAEEVEPEATEEGTEEATEEAEPEAEEEVGDDEAEAASAAAGNEDVAQIIETVAGITIAAVLHYATKLQASNCKKGTAALGALNYVNGMIKPVADEIAEPDGKVSVPAVTIDLSECADG